MSDQRDPAADEVLETLRSLVGTTLRDQIQRQSRINPYIDRRKIEQIEIARWAERLRRLADEADQKEEYERKNAFEALIESLPALVSNQ